MGFLPDHLKRDEYRHAGPRYQQRLVRNTFFPTLGELECRRLEHNAKLAKLAAIGLAASALLAFAIVVLK